MSNQDSQKLDELRDLLQSVRYRLRALTIVVIVLAMMLTLTFVIIVAEMVNYFAGDNLIYSGSAVLGILVGFLAGLFAGWIARRRA